MNRRSIIGWLIAFALIGVTSTRLTAEEPSSLEKPELKKGICVVLGLEKTKQAGLVQSLCKDTDLLIYIQSPDGQFLSELGKDLDRAGYLGNRVFVRQGEIKTLYLADNLADAIHVLGDAREQISEAELLRVLLPEGKAYLGGRVIQKEYPKGMDTWSHVYYGPENNPLSADQNIQPPYQTQFFAEPMFSPLPVFTVTAGNKVFKIMGHLAFRENQNRYLNTLLCANAFNGTILWTRPLREGFLHHRNCYIATSDILYLGDDESCKFISTATGKTLDEIVVPDGIADGKTWKWMALKDGVLYALVGHQEKKADAASSKDPGMSHWSWNAFSKYAYTDPSSDYGSGRTFLAIDLKTKKILWQYRQQEYIDNRAVCMNKTRIFFLAPNHFLACLNLKTGELVWQTNEPGLMERINPKNTKQSPRTGFSTEPYIKCNEKYVFFAGYPVQWVTAVSAENGKFLWQMEELKRKIEFPHYHLVLEERGVVAITTYPGGRLLDYETGKHINDLHLPSRWNCVRVTGTKDYLFSRGGWGAGTWSYSVKNRGTDFFSPMRPGCFDGVMISQGMLSWGPYACGTCNISVYGHVAVAHGYDVTQRVSTNSFVTEPGELRSATVKTVGAQPNDWPHYCQNTARTMFVSQSLSSEPTLKWTCGIGSTNILLTAPIAVRDAIYLGDSEGAVHCFSKDGKRLWKTYTGGSVNFPPEYSDGRLLLGSMDGYVYSLEAATGKQLWRFRAAPAERIIPVYGRLASTWPVNGGVVVDGNTVYAASGMTDYDGTYVFALDATTGKMKWMNDNSKNLTEFQEIRCGIGLQGDLFIEEGKLKFKAGTVYKTASYDLTTGANLDEPKKAQATSKTCFSPFYGRYAGFLEIAHTFESGDYLVANRWWQKAGALTLIKTDGAGDKEKHTSKQPDGKSVLWTSKEFSKVQDLIPSTDGVLVSGISQKEGKKQAALAFVSISDGRILWRQELSSLPVRNGIAVAANGLVIAALDDGSVVCLGR